MRGINDKPLTRKQYLLKTIHHEADFVRDRLNHYINSKTQPTDVQLWDMYISIQELIRAVNKL